MGAIKDFFNFYASMAGERSPSSEFMAKQLQRHENSLLNVKEAYYFVRDYIFYDHEKVDRAGGEEGLWAKLTTLASWNQYPVETLAYRKGVCIDKAILLCVLLEIMGEDAVLLICGEPKHAFNAVYLPGVGGDHLARGSFPQGSPKDWLLLDATGGSFGDAWALDEPGFRLNRIVDIEYSHLPSLQVVDAYWSIDNQVVTEADVGDYVTAHVSLIASGGATSGTVELRVVKDWATWYESPWHDELYKTASFIVDIPWGEIQTIDLTFVPDEPTGTLGYHGTSVTLRGYYIEVCIDKAFL